MEKNTSYPAANMSDEFKTHLAKLYVVQHKKGKSRADFVNDLSESGLVVSPRQLDRWVSRVNSNKTAISFEKFTGNENALDREKRDVTSGWVLEQLEIGEEVHLKTFVDFAFDKFGIGISLMTAGNYLKEDGFTPRTLQKKSASFIIEHEQLRIDLWNWFKSRQLKLNNIIRTKLCSFGFTYTGHRQERRKGYGIKGGSQPVESSKISKYTNAS